MEIRVIAVDDHYLILRALEDLFKEDSDIKLVATSNQGSQLLKLVREYNPDVAIIDIGIQSFDPISAVKELHDQYPNVKTLILTGYDEGLWVRDLIKAGASGYMLKSDNLSLSIPKAIRDLYLGRKFFSAGLAEKLAENEMDKLDSREISVLHLLSQGLATEVVAEKLGVSNKRIRNLLVVICDKLAVDRADGVSPRIAAINKARELGLIPKDMEKT